VDIRKWWSSDDRETYWMETTDRKDIGRNLNAPQRKENGDEYWGYDLLNHVAPGDTVFHYHKPSYSVVATSQIAGSAHDYRVVWAARGTSARRSGVKEHARPGWRVPLANHRALNTPVTLARLR
jgi:hypothetical protein